MIAHSFKNVCVLFVFRVWLSCVCVIHISFIFMLFLHLIGWFSFIYIFQSLSSSNEFPWIRFLYASCFFSFSLSSLHYLAILTIRIVFFRLYFILFCYICINVRLFPKKEQNHHHQIACELKVNQKNSTNIEIRKNWVNKGTKRNARKTKPLKSAILWIIT